LWSFASALTVTLNCTVADEVYFAWLDIAQNKIKSIKGLSHLKYLRKIDLGANRIRVIEGLEGLVSLEELWLGKNKIEKIEGLDKVCAAAVIVIKFNNAKLMNVLHYSSAIIAHETAQAGCAIQSPHQN
jgi:hypothetical protein